MMFNKPEEFNPEYSLVRTVHNINNQHDTIMKRMKELEILINITNMRIDDLKKRVEDVSDCSVFVDNIVIEPSPTEQDEEPSAQWKTGTCILCGREERPEKMDNEWEICQECINMGNELVKGHANAKEWNELKPGGKKSRLNLLKKHFHQSKYRLVYDPKRDPIKNGTEDNL